ncbi:Cell division protein ZapA [Exaiptasia diaphana]|nr:Cell division protein ZapA [Exaiptasia diaphana]
MSKAWLQDLEEKVQEAAARLKEQKALNQELEAQNSQLQERVEELEAQVADAGDDSQSSEWQEERQEIRERVEKLVDHLPEMRDKSMEPRSTTSVDVEIFGSVYHVRGEQDREYLLKLADIVNTKMREIGDHMPVVDTGKIAILAALNLADELLQSNQQQEGERVEIMEKVNELTGELSAALES